MSTTNLFSVSMLLCSAFVAVNACEMNCHFNVQHKDYNQVIQTIQPPAQTAWQAQNQLDKVDKLIFKARAFPYSYQQIINTPDEQKYVLKSEFNPLLQKAREFFAKQKKRLQDAYAAEVRYTDSQLLNMTLAKARVDEYMAMLERSSSYRHICPGALVPARTLMCVVQWMDPQN